MQQSNTHYSLKWSWGIYRELYARYGRALTSFNEIWGIPDRIPVAWLANRSVRWLNYKKLLKIWYNWEISSPGAWEDPKLLHARIVLFKFMMKQWGYTRVKS